MSFANPQESGKPVAIKDEGITLVASVSSIDFAGAGVSGSAIGNDVTETISGGGGGSGDVVGPASATDNAVARFDTTTGKLIQNSVVTISDTGEVAGIYSEETSRIKGSSTPGTDITVDGGFETWTNPSTLTNWATQQIAGTGVVAREGTIKRSGTYSVKFTGDDSNIAYVESAPVTSLTPSDIYTFLGYQRNDSGAGNGAGGVCFFNGTSTSTATQIYKFATSTWVTWVDWATTVLSGDPSEFITFGSEATSFTSYTITVSVPANGTLTTAVLGAPLGAGSFTVYVDDVSLTSASTPAAAQTLYDFKNQTTFANLDSSDTIFKFGVTSTNALSLGGTGLFDSDFSSFNFSNKVVKVATPVANADAVNISYYNANMFALPTQTGNNGKYLKTDGSSAAWDLITLASADFANQGTTTTVLHGNAAGNPSWGAVSLTADVSGTLPIASGGTNGTSFTNNGLVYFDGSKLTNESELTYDPALNALSIGGVGTSTGKTLFTGATSGIVTLSVADVAGTWTMKLPATAGSNTQVLQTDGSGNTSWVAAATGTVTTLSVATANGFAGSVANATTTPVITLTTSVIGILVGDGTTISSAATTGAGNVVLATSPTLITPVLGVAAATSINKVAITAPATSATLTIADGKTLTASNTLTLTGTDSSSVAFGVGGTVAYLADKLSVFAATSSSELAGVISDETGSGPLVFATAPTFTNSITLGAASGTTGSALFKGTTSGTVTMKTADAAGTWTLTLPTTAGTNGYVLQTDGAGVTSWVAAGSGSGTVTSVSVTTANGVSGSVANATTTPAITLTLGAITPSSVNGVSLSTAAGGTNFLAGDGTYKSVSAGSAQATAFSVNQVAHGFSVGNAIKSSGSANAYSKATADSAANAEVVGVVTVVTDVDNFTFTTHGIITTGVPAVAAGTTMFLDPSTAGALTSTEPTTVTQVSKPVMVVLENATKALVLNLRGMLIVADPVVPTNATGAEINTGTDNAKWVTSLAIADSNLSFTDGSETLTNKTLTTPVINLPTGTIHIHDQQIISVQVFS